MEIGGHMKTVVIIFLILIILAVGAMFAFGDELGITDECVTFLCRNNAQFMRDFCSDCRQVLDRNNSFIDGIADFFR